jgi:hypothetical protein
MSLLASYGLGPETVLYREAVFADLTPGESADQFVLRAWYCTLPAGQVTGRIVA